MDKPNKKLKGSSSAKLISHYVKNIEFNSTSKKPVSHYVKNDEPISHCSKPISHYIRTGQLKHCASSLVSDYFQSNGPNCAENSEAEPVCVENRRVRSRRNYISQIISSSEPSDARPGRNISQILNENSKENQSSDHHGPTNEPSRKMHKVKSVLISDYIKNIESQPDCSIYLGKSQLISKLIGLDASICPSPSDSKSPPIESKESEAELSQSVANLGRKKSRGNFISFYLQASGSHESAAASQKCDLASREKSFVKLRRSKLISQYMRNEKMDWNSGQLSVKAEETKQKSKQAIRSRYISSFIKQYEDHTVLADSPHTLNKIIRRNLALTCSKSGRRAFRRSKGHKDRFLKKYIKLDNIVNRLRKTKKLD
ncbi:hypothetical protein BpHYR1_006075 [Brachionus plicatilis]|uniref:Uncharacterized protein n=1 Tax=Brachionus plicatilis TaxID=10195 RepID=A0A3M7RD40_BRAPC|nr:hypothetical protein BpHYR1_006075 [Brachionus plicatilis]